MPRTLRYRVHIKIDDFNSHTGPVSEINDTNFTEEQFNYIIRVIRDDKNLDFELTELVKNTIENRGFPRAAAKPVS